MNERKPAAAAAHAVFSDHCGAPLLYIAAKIEECSHSPFMNLNSRLQFRRFVFPSPFHCLLPCSIMRPSPSATTVAGFGAPPPPPSSLSPSPTYLSVPDLNAAANLFSHRCSLSSSWISIRISHTLSATDTPPRYYRQIGSLPQPKLARACSCLCLES